MQYMLAYGWSKQNYNYLVWFLHMSDKGDKLSCNTCLHMVLPNNRILITSGFSTCYKQVITYHVWFFHMYIMLYAFAYGFTNQVYKYHFWLFNKSRTSENISCITCVIMVFPNKRKLITSGFSACYKQVNT